MNGVIEIIAATLIVVAVFCHSATRKWFSSIGPLNRKIMVALIALMVIGQVVNESRRLFPFVRWGMYTEIYDDEKVFIGRFQALHANGEYSWVNPTHYYPSLARNNHDRVQHFMIKLRDDDLSPYVTGLFEQYMSALGRRHAAQYPGNPVLEIHAVLQSIESSNYQVFTTNQVVRSVKIRERRAVEIARSTP